MRLIKMFSLAALAAVVAMALVGATSASALRPTALCKEHGNLNGFPLEHAQLLCPLAQVYNHLLTGESVHQLLASGTVGKLLSSLVNVLCLGVLVEATPLGLGSPLNIHTLASSYTGCGTSSTHNNCTVTVEEQPLGTLLKTGLDAGTITLTSGRVRLQCANLGIDCKYDNEATEFAAGGMHLTATETPTVELGGKFFCPDEGKLDGLLEDLPETLTYILE